MGNPVSALKEFGDCNGWVDPLSLEDPESGEYPLEVVEEILDALQRAKTFVRTYVMDSWEDDGETCFGFLAETDKGDVLPLLYLWVDSSTEVLVDKGDSNPKAANKVFKDFISQI
jgi:hypothetical protein